MDKKMYVTPEMEELKFQGQVLMLNESTGIKITDDEVDPDY